MITSLFQRKEEKYLSWEEYKKKMIEIQVINLIERFVKQNSNYSYSDIGDLRITKLDKLGGGKNEGHLLK